MTSDWTTRMWPACLASSGMVSDAVWVAELGRYILTGTWRSSNPGGFNSLLLIVLKSTMSSDVL